MSGNGPLGEFDICAAFRVGFESRNTARVWRALSHVIAHGRGSHEHNQCVTVSMHVARQIQASWAARHCVAEAPQDPAVEGKLQKGIMRCQQVLAASCLLVLVTAASAKYETPSSCIMWIIALWFKDSPTSQNSHQSIVWCLFLVPGRLGSVMTWTAPHIPLLRRTMTTRSGNTAGTPAPDLQPGSILQHQSLVLKYVLPRWAQGKVG